MDQVPNQRYKVSLDERTLAFAKRIITLTGALSKDTINKELVRQGVRSGTSVGANYREANDALSKKDFIHRMRITRKETKETVYWLELIIHTNPYLEKRVTPLLQEARELVKIFSAIIEKSK